MKKIIITSIITSSILLAGPAHTLMDDRIKGQSYSGEKTDYNASKDGLGIIPLQHHSGTSQINNELKIQKKLVELKKKTIDISKLSNIKQSLTNGEIGTIQDKNFIEKLENSLTNNTNNEYISKTLNSCNLIKNQHPESTDGIYELKDYGQVYCDMTTNGGGWTLFSKLRGQDIRPSTGSDTLPISEIGTKFLSLKGLTDNKNILLGGTEVLIKSVNNNEHRIIPSKFYSIAENDLSTMLAFNSSQDLRIGLSNNALVMQSFSSSSVPLFSNLTPIQYKCDGGNLYSKNNNQTYSETRSKNIYFMKYNRTQALTSYDWRNSSNNKVGQVSYSSSCNSGSTSLSNSDQFNFYIK